jgi:hypothetical protein
MMRAPAILILVALAPAACTLNAGGPSIPVGATDDSRGWTRLAVDARIASALTLTAGDGTAVSATATLTPLVDVDNDAFRRNLRLAFFRSGDTLQLVADSLEPLASDAPVPEVSIQVGMPGDRALDVEGDKLDVTTEGMTGAVRVAVAVGELAIDTTGDVDLATARGGVHGRAGGGTVQATDGPVSLQWPATRSLSIDGDKGAIEVLVPPGAGFSTRLSSGSGDVEVDTGDTRATGPAFDGTVGGGGAALLSATLASGHITLHSLSVTSPVPEKPAVKGKP